MNVKRFFREAAQHAALTGSNSYTGDTFATATDIQVRWFTENELIRNSDGQEVTTAARISTTANVGLGDRITRDGTDWHIVQLRVNRDTKGNFSHRVAWLA